MENNESVNVIDESNESFLLNQISNKRKSIGDTSNGCPDKKMKRSVIVTLDAKIHAVESVKNGMTLTQAANEVGCSPALVSYWRNNYNKLLAKREVQFGSNNNDLSKIKNANLKNEYPSIKHEKDNSNQFLQCNNQFLNESLDLNYDSSGDSSFKLGQLPRLNVSSSCANIDDFTKKRTVEQISKGKRLCEASRELHVSPSAIIYWTKSYNKICEKVKKLEEKVIETPNIDDDRLTMDHFYEYLEHGRKLAKYLLRNHGTEEKLQEEIGLLYRYKKMFKDTLLDQERAISPSSSD